MVDVIHLIKEILNNGRLETEAALLLDSGEAENVLKSVQRLDRNMAGKAAS